MVLAWAIAGLFLTRSARADEELLVVDVTPSASHLDADELRRLIGGELHALALRPDDPRAASASGTLTVDVDRTSRALAVTYLARAKPTTRRVALPADGASARSAAVLLAGNLARDEASELAAELRKQHPPAAPPVAPQKPADGNDDDLRARGRDAARLQATLDYHVKRESHANTVGWTVMVVSPAVGSAALATAPGFHSPLAGVVSCVAGTGPVLIGLGFGLGGLLSESALETLAASHRKGAEASATEEEWRAFAQRERSLRRGLGVGELTFSALTLGAGVTALARPSMFSSTQASQEFAAVTLGFSAAEALLGVYLLTTEGPVESALHSYEVTTGRVAAPKAAWLRHLNIGPLPGGGMASFGVTF